MDKALLKRWLIDGQHGAYSIIVDTYNEQIRELKPLMFKQLLAIELQLNEEKINLGSLNSALTRKKKRQKMDTGPGSVKKENPELKGYTKDLKFTDEDQNNQKKKFDF